jgi:hypothetical protein
MSTFRGGSFLVALLAAALALGACGGDEGGNDGTTGAGSPEFTTNSGTTTTGTTDATTRGTTERERTGTSEDRTTNTKEGGDDRGGSGGGDSRGKGDSGSAAQPAEQPGNVFKVAQTVCNSFLPKPIERSLKEGKREPEDVARDYSRGFSDKQEKRAYEGCLAGLKKR